jgi:hypothetical protein
MYISDEQLESLSAMHDTYMNAIDGANDYDYYSKIGSDVFSIIEKARKESYKRAGRNIVRASLKKAKELVAKRDSKTN